MCCRNYYSKPRMEVCPFFIGHSVLFASDDDDWGVIPPIEGDDEDDF